MRNLVMLLTGMMGNAVPGWLITYFHVLSCFNNKSMHFKSPLSIEIWAQNTGWESSSTNIIVVWNYLATHQMLSRIHNPEFQFVFHQLAWVMFVCLFQIVDLLFFTAKNLFRKKDLSRFGIWDWKLVKICGE